MTGGTIAAAEVPVLLGKTVQAFVIVVAARTATFSEVGFGKICFRHMKAHVLMTALAAFILHAAEIAGVASLAVTLPGLVNSVQGPWVPGFVEREQCVGVALRVQHGGDSLALDRLCNSLVCTGHFGGCCPFGRQYWDNQKPKQDWKKKQPGEWSSEAQWLLQFI